jgi:hypothetical protein
MRSVNDGGWQCCLGIASDEDEGQTSALDGLIAVDRIVVV